MDVEHSVEFRTVAIVGLGLIGGSVARDLAGRGVRVLGWDADQHALRAAVADGAVHHPLGDDLAEVCQADAVVVAVPVLAAADVLRTLAPHLDGVRLITDVGSTKTSIVRAAEALGIGARFVGSHPLTGDHRSGWEVSRTGLFADARVFLCRTRTTENDAMRLASDLWTRIGGRPEVMDAREHDVRLAWTSHLPHLASFALGSAMAGQGVARAELGPGGRDVTRLAGSSPQMWADVALDNADALVPALAAAEQRLREIRDLVENRQHARLGALLAATRRWHGAEP